MSILPSAALAPTTSTVGVFRAGIDQIGPWLQDGLNEGSITYSASVASGSIRELIELLRPLTIPRIKRYLLLESGPETLVLNSSSLGTDLGMLPSLCARELGVAGIRATLVEGECNQYPATILEVFAPDGEEPLLNRRTLCAANDGGRWVFNQAGEPYEFEDLRAYQSTRIKDRFTAAMLRRYLECLGVHGIPNLEFRPRSALLLSA